MRTISVAEASDPDFVEQWRALAEEASEPNPFFEPWFLLPSLKAFAQPSNRVELFVHETGGRMSGLFPITHSNRYYGYAIPHVAGWLHSNAFYGAPLVRCGVEREFWSALLAFLDDDPGLAVFFHAPLIEANGPLDRALTEELARKGREAATVLNQQRALLASDLSSEEYFAQSLSKKHRKELRRHSRRLAEEGAITFERRNDAIALDEWIADYLALEAVGWKGEAGSAFAQDPASETFFAETIRQAAEAGKLERLTMRLDHIPIAMLSSFIVTPGAYSFKTAFDERFAAHSPGMQLQIENLATLERSDVAWTDSCAAEGHPMIERLWTERRHLVSRNIAIGGRLRRALFRMIAAHETRENRE